MRERRKELRVLWLALALLLAPDRAVAGSALALFPDPLGFGVFGESIAAVGGNVAVGSPAPYLDDGAAYLVDGTTGAVLHSFEPSTSYSEDFGAAVAAFGSDVLIGSIRESLVYLFSGATGALIRTFEHPVLTYGFGASVAALGSNVVVGSFSDVSVLDGSTGAVVQTLLLPSGGSFFGYPLAVDGNNVLVGDPDDDTGGTDAGSAHLFDGTTGALLRSFSPPPSAAGAFGRSVAFAGGSVLVAAPGDDTVGPDAGAAYLFDAGTGAVLQTFLPAGAGSGFGHAVASMSGNVLVAAPLDDTIGEDAGAVFLFDAGTGAVLRTIVSPHARSSGVIGSPQHEVSFGVAIAALGDGILVGATNDLRQGAFYQQYGVAYLFCGGASGCGPCETCGPLGTCVADVNPTCSTAETRRMTFRLRNITPDDRDQAALTGKAPSVGNAFGNPAVAHDYTLCVFEESGPTPNLVFRATAPHGGTCDGKPCWKLLGTPASPKGYTYVDRDRTPDGVRKLIAGEVTVGTFVFRGSGPHLSDRPLGLPPLPLPLPLRTQLQAEDGSCWEATYSTARVNDGERLVVQSD